VYFATHRPSRELPSDLDPESVQRYASVMTTHRSAIVGFGSYYDQMAPPDSLARVLGFPRVAEFPDGSIWAEEPLSYPR
jgi:hypothetical protein